MIQKIPVLILWNLDILKEVQGVEQSLKLLNF